jgi:hypothetical protein
VGQVRIQHHVAREEEDGGEGGGRTYCVGSSILPRVMVSCFLIIEEVGLHMHLGHRVRLAFRYAKGDKLGGILDKADSIKCGLGTMSKTPDEELCVGYSVLPRDYPCLANIPGPFLWTHYV